MAIFQIMGTYAEERADHMKTLIQRLLWDENGQGIVEYVLIISFIVIALILSLTDFKDGVVNLYTNIRNGL